MATFLSIPTRRSHARWGEWFSPRPLLRGMKLTGTITGPCNVPHGDTVNRSTLYEPQWIPPDGNRPLDLSIHSAPSIFPLSTSCPIHVSILVNLDSRRQPWYGVVQGEGDAIKVLASCAFSPRYLLILGDIDRNVHTVQLFDEGKRLPIYQQRGSRILKLLTYLYVREFTRIIFNTWKAVFRSYIKSCCNRCR